MDKLTKEIGKILTPPKSFFKWCERQIPTYQWANKEKTISASNRTDCPIIKKKLTKKSRLTFYDKFYSFAIVLVSKNRIEIQSYGYWHEIKDGKETIEMRLTNFERFSNWKHLTAFNYNGAWSNGLRQNYGYMSGHYTNTVFYPNNWQDKFKNNRDMKYLSLPKIERSQLARIYKYRGEIEYLQNIGAAILADEIINDSYVCINGSYHKSTNMGIINRKWLKTNKALIKQLNPSFNHIMLHLILKKRNIKTVKDFENNFHFSQLKKLPNEVNLSKFQEWYLKQKQSFNYYLDYLNMLQELTIPLNDNTVIFPKSLTVAHDNAVELINQLNLEKKEQELKADQLSYQKRANQLLAFEKEIDEFIFLVPKELQEIILEGSALHHCVGSNNYIQQHKKGDTNIIFIRKKHDIDTPYFTMEYKNNNVEQIQGKYNRENVPSALTNAVTKWEQAIKKIS